MSETTKNDQELNMPASDDFTLGEAKRQIKALWEKMNEIRSDYKAIIASASHNGEELVRLSSKMDEYMRMLDSFLTGNALPMCIRHGEDINRILEKFSEHAAAHKDGSLCINTKSIGVMESKVSRHEKLIWYMSTVTTIGLVVYLLRLWVSGA